MIQDVFNAYFCDPRSFPHDKLSPTAFRCFVSLFRKVNASKQLIDVQSNKTIKRKDERIIGFDAIWAIILNSTNKAVQEMAMNLLVDL